MEEALGESKFKPRVKTDVKLSLSRALNALDGAGDGIQAYLPLSCPLLPPF